MSLLANDKVSMHFSLAQTADLDAVLDMNSAVKNELALILRKHGLVYDDDSHLVWKPEGTRFEPFLDLKNVTVKSIDPESALVSKAVKAPQKNKQLIRQALASGRFSKLADRIESAGGDLAFFAKD